MPEIGNYDESDVFQSLDLVTELRHMPFKQLDAVEISLSALECLNHLHIPRTVCRDFPLNLWLVDRPILLKLAAHEQSLSLKPDQYVDFLS